jgi:hypothetical protein
MDTTDQKTNSETNPAGAGAGADPGKTEDQQVQGASPAEKSPETVSREAYQALQSRADKASADARRAREDADKAVADAVRARREAEVANLKPEDRVALERSWNLEDRERRLAAAEKDQEAVAKELAVAKLSLDNGLTPAQKVELEAIDDVNEMRAKAAELRAERLQTELEAAKSGAGKVDSPKVEPKPAPKGMRGDPAGSGSGGSGAAYDGAKFKGTGDLAGSLAAKRAAGDIVYERIPTPGR